MIVTAFLYIISAIGCALSTNIVWLNIFRLMSGLGVGATSVVVPMYISEISPAYKRGYLVSFNQFAITIGILLAYVFDYFLIGLGDNSWRYMLAVPAFFGIIYLILLLTSFPESPRWLFARGRKEEARQILYKIGGDKFIKEKLPAIEESLARDQQKEKISIGELFRGKTGKVVLIGTLLAAFQQITGVNAVLIYAPDIFQAAGSLKESSMLQSMLVALYNMALEEMQLNLRTDSTFATGALWPDTWTRDVVYSIYFAFSWIHPDISKKTLQKQTLSNPKEALQDTGTGGSWPISTDRVVWALAAWEYYLTTGDKDWLAEAYEGLSYTAEKDIHVAFDPNTGLFKGETCSMDWRTHTYPNWFSNENIGESFSSGTKALHMFMYDFLIRSGKILGKDNNEIAVWEKYHTSIKAGLNKQFWDEERGIYTVYLYPEFLGYRSSQRVGIMSNGLCALLGVATEQQVQSIVKNYPLYPYGGAVLYPTIPDDYSYHNKSIWAVWQTPYMYAAKRAGNIAAVEHIIKSAIRQGAMFLTHKENMTHDTGYDRNTALNSDRQLWSVASFTG